MKLQEVVIQDGEEIVVELPAKHEVCSRCHGHGKIVNPALSVWTEEDRAADPEGFRSMLAGDYDISCPDCKGLRVVKVVDLVRAKQDDPKGLALYLKNKAAIDELRAMERSEFRTQALMSGVPIRDLD